MLFSLSPTQQWHELLSLQLSGKCYKMVDLAVTPVFIVKHYNVAEHKRDMSEAVCGSVQLTALLGFMYECVFKCVEVLDFL